MAASAPYFAEIATDFERRNFPFWVCEAEPDSDAALLDRGGQSRSIVAVCNHQRGDYRLKIWLTDDLTPGAFGFRINGYTFSLSRQRYGYYAGSVDRADLLGAMRGRQAAFADGEWGNGETPIEAGPYLDACVETVFQEGDYDYSKWVGDVTDFPDWMAAQSITITGPRTGGGWHCVTLKTDLGERDVHLLSMVRVNGVWCSGSPVIDSFDSSGQGFFAGTIQLLCDPDDMEEIRSFGDGLAVAPGENEPIPPRSRHSIQVLRRYVDLPYQEDAAWQADIKVMRNALVKMCASQGQGDVCHNLESRYIKRLRAYERALAQGAKKAGVDPLGISHWAEQAGGKPKSWLNSARTIQAFADDYRARAMRFEDYVASGRDEYEAALERCLAREAQYADVIPLLYPAE